MSNVEFREPALNSTESGDEMEGNDRWFVGDFELPNGVRMMYYDGTAESQEDAEKILLENYETAKLVADLAEKLASRLGGTARNLLELAIARVDYPEPIMQTDMTT